MPTVPVYGGPRVQRSPLPNVQQNPNAPAGAFGSPEPVNLSGVQQVAGQLALEEKRKADQVAVLDADNQLASLSTQLETAALQRKGKDALGATQAVQAEWQQKSAEIEGGLTSDDQRVAFQQHQSARWNALHQTVELHAARESEQYDTEQTKSAIENTYSDALKNPASVSDAVARTTALWKDYATRQGMSPEAMTDGLNTAVSHLHAGVFERILETPATDGGGDLAAKAYLAQHRDAMTGTDQAKADQLMHAGSVRGASQRATDAIVAQKSTIGDALKEAANIPDPDVRDAVEQRIRQHFADERTAQRDDEDAALREASAIVERNGGNYDAVPLSLRLRMSPQDRNALQGHARQLRNPVRVTNQGLYHSLLNSFALPGAREWVLTHPIEQYRSQLSDEDYDRIQAMWLDGNAQKLSAYSADLKRDSDKQAAEQAKQDKSDAFIEQQIELAPPDQKDARINAFRTMMSPQLQAKYNLTAPVPGAPIVRTPQGGPSVIVRAVPGRVIPQAWLDRAQRDPAYRDYAERMGYIEVLKPSQTSGNVNLRVTP